MDELLKIRIDKMISIQDIVKNEYKWSSDQYTRHFTALNYALNDKEFNLSQFKDIQEFIKDNTKLFSHYRSHERFTLASLLVTKLDDPKESFKNILYYESKLSSEGFTKGPFLAIAAYALLLTCASDKIDDRIKRAREIYKRMKEKHFWLTGQDDYPLAVLIAASEKDIDNIIDEIEGYYDALHNEGLTRSNGLQQLSHILTFSHEPQESKVKRCSYFIHYLKDRKLSVYTHQYGLMGLIALPGDNGTKVLDGIIEVYEYIKDRKSYKWLTKEVKLLLSSSLVCNKYIEDIKQNKTLLEASIGISVEALIAAQQAAVIAAVSASSIAAASASSST